MLTSEVGLRRNEGVDNAFDLVEGEPAELGAWDGERSIRRCALV